MHDVKNFSSEYIHADNCLQCFLLSCIIICYEPFSTNSDKTAIVYSNLLVHTVCVFSARNREISHLYVLPSIIFGFGFRLPSTLPANDAENRLEAREKM